MLEDKNPNQKDVPKKTSLLRDYFNSKEGQNDVYKNPRYIEIDKITEYDPNNYVIQKEDTSESVIKELNYARGANQGVVSEIGNAVLGGLGKLPFTVIGNVASIFDFEDYNNVDKEVGNSITAWTEEQKGNIEEATKIYKSNDNTLGSREWWINNGKGLIDSAGGFVVTGALTGGVIGKTTGLLGNGLKMLTQIKNSSNVVKGLDVGINIANKLTNATALNQAESVPIAMNVFKNSYELKMEEFSEAIDNGSMTKEDAEILATDTASDAASYSININRINIPLNISSAGAFLRPASLTRQIAKDMSKKAIAKRLILEGGQEYVEENVNMIAENEAMLKAQQGKDYSYNFERTTNEILSKQGFEQGIVGFVGGIAQTSLTESVYDKIKKDAPSYDKDGNVQYNNDGSPILTSRYNSNVQKFNAQKKSLNDIESLAKSSSVPTVKETLDNLKESSELINDIQIASLKNEDIQVELLQNKLLSNQALSSFKNGTAGNLIDMYDSFAKDPSSKEKFGENYLSKISQAKSDIELLEDIYTQHSSLPQVNESYKNRSEYLYTVRELEKSSLELSKVYSEQQKEISLTKTEDLDVINAMPITKKLNKQVENVGVLREKALLLNNDYNNIITDEFGKSIVNKNKFEEDNQVPEEVETPEVKTKKEAKAEEVDKELESKFNQLTTIDNFSDLNLLRNEIKNHPLHTKEMLNQINEKEKQLKSIINTFAENIINNTLENNDNNQQFLKNNLEDVEKRIQELKAIKDIKKPVFDDILKQSGVEPGSEVEQDEQTEEEVNAQQKLVSEANSQGLFSDNESTQFQIDSEKSPFSIEKGINVKNNVVMVHIFDHYFDNGVFKFDRNEDGFPKHDNVSQIDINALNSLKIGDKLDFELIKVSSQVEGIYRSLKDYDGKHIAIKHNGRLVGFVQQPHPVSPKSQDPAFSEKIRQELIEYRKQVISLINQGISVTEKVEDKGTGNLYTKINVTNSKKLIAADFNVFETARPQDKINGSLVFVYADQAGKLMLPKSSNQDISSSDIISINKRLNELANFKLKPGKVYQLVKDLTGKWYPMPVYANKINSKTLDNIEEVLSFANNSSETKNIIRDLQPYIYASSSRVGAMMAIIKENDKINVWANGKRISLDDFNNVDVLRKEFLKNILGLPQNIDVININNPSVQEKMADRENLFTNVTTFEGEYFVQPYIEYSQNSMLRKEAPITNYQVNKLSAVQPSSEPSTSVSTDNKANIEKLRAQEQADLVKAGINLTEFKDTYGENKGNMPDDLYSVYKPIYDKYNALITKLSESKPSKPNTEEDIKKQLFQEKLNRANNAIVKEKGASKTLDNTILNRNLFEKWLKKNLPQLNLSDVNNVLALKDTIIDAFGLFKDSTIFLFEGAGMKTAYHEAFHGVFRNLLTVKQREEIISEAKTKYPAPTLEDLNNLQKDLKNQYTEQQLTYLYYEEQIADSFATFANDKNSKSLLGKLSDAIIDFFNKIIQYFNFFKSKKTSALESLFDNINNGKLATIKSNSNSVVNIPIFNEYAYSKKLNQQLGVSNKSRTVEAIGNAFMAKYQEALLGGEKIVPLSVFQSVLDIYSEKLMSLDENSDDFALCGKIILNFPELISEVKKYLSIRNVKIKDEIQYKEVAGELTTLKDNGGIEITVPLDLDEVEDNEVYTLESKTSKGFTDWTSISGLSSSSARLKLFLSSIPVLDYSKRVPVNVFDEFGIQKYWDFHELYVHIEDNLIDLYEFEEKIDKLKELSINRPELKQVINKLTNRPSNYNQEQFDLLQNDFDTNFNKQNLLYTLFKFDTDSSTGQTTHEIIESNRTSLARQLSDSWKSNVFDVNKKNIIGFYDKGEGKIDTKKAKKLLDEWNGLPENPKAKFINTKLLKAGIEYSNNTILKLVEENDSEWKKDVATVLEYYASGLDLSRQKTFREAMFRLVGKEVDNSKNKNSMSFIDGRNKNIFAVQLPTFISKTIVKIKNKDKFTNWMSKLQQDSFYKNSNILSILKNKSDFKDNFKVSYLDASKDSRGTKEGVSFTKITPKDYAITQIASFRNLAVNSQKETSLPINKYFYLTPADKSMQVIIDSTSTQVMVDSKGELLIESSPIIYNGQGNMHYYNVFLQEANRIKTNIDIKNDIILNKGTGKYKLNMLLENYHMSKENFQELSKLAVKDELTEDDVNNLNKMFNGFAYKFNCFSDSFNKTLGKDLIEIIENSTKDNLESNLESIKKQVITGIAKDIQDDFNTTLKEMLFKGVIEKNNKTGLYSSKTIELVKNIDKLTNEEVKRTDQKVSDDILNILVEFSANTKLNNIEFSNIFNGDIAKYKARNLAKRAPQAQTMTIFGNFINKVIKTRVVKDIFSKLSTKEYDNIYDSLKDSGVSDSEIKSTIDPYLKTNSTDAEVYISPELYKRIHIATGNWSPEMQSAYDIAEGSVISEIPQNLRRKLLGIKPFYFGDRFNEDLGIMDFEQVKCSMIPLFKAYTDLNPLLADIRKNMLKKDKNGNTTLDMVAHESAFKATLGFRNDIFDSTGSVTLDLNTDNFGIQTSNVDHIEDGNDSTRQIKMLMFSAIDPNKSYRGTNGKELIDLINKLEATNIKQSLKEVLVKMNVKDNVEFSKFIETSISKRKENINVEEGLLLENGDFKYALDSGNLSTQVENLISSVFTDNAVKQEFEIGGDAVQASSIGFKFKSEFNNLLEQQKNLTKEQLIEQGKLEWIKPNKENGYIEFAEAAMPAWTKKFFNEKGFLIDAENIPEELRQLIIYRIPTEGLHSMLQIKVVNFLPETMGNFILLPDQIVTQFGADFDFDKILFIGKDFYKTINEDKEEYFRPYTYYPNQNETGLRYNDYLQYTSLNKLDQMDFNYFSKLSIEEQNVRPARNNEIVNSYFKVLTEIKNLNLLIKPSSFEVLTKFKKDNFSQEVEENYFSSSTQRELKDKNHVAIDLKGQVALHVTGHSYGTLMNLNTASYIKVDKNKTKLNLDKTVNIDGEKRTNFSGLYNEDGQLISDEIASVLAAVLDDIQNPILKTLGIDNNTVDVFISILRSGKSLNDALTFIAQPIIKELSANLINNTNKIKEFNQGQFSVDDLISICKTNAKESLSKIKDNDNPSISMFFDKIEDNEFYIKTKDIKQYVDNFDKDNFIKTADELEVLKYWSNQARALKQFKNIEIISKELVKTNKIFAINKEVGPNIEDIISKKQILLDLLDSKVLNGFDLRRIPSLEATWSVHTAALNWFGNYFPYGSKKYMEIKEYLAFQQGSKNIAEYPVKDRIFMNSFIRTFTDYKSFLFQDVDKEYVKLLRELPAQINDIFKFHEEEMFLGTTSYNVLRNNVFLKEIKEYQDKDNENYYLQLKGNRLNLQVKNNVISGLTALYKSEDPMVREFAIDLIKHSFLSTGFFKGVNSYASLISPEILDDLKVEGIFPGETTTELQSYNEFRKNAIYNLNSDFAPNLPALRIIKQMIRNNPRVFTKVFDSKMFTENSTNGLPKTITTNKLKIKEAKRLNDMLWEDLDGIESSPLIISVFDEYIKQVKLYERNDSNVINSENKDDFSTITYNEITPLGKIGNLIEIYINEENPVSRLKNNNSDENSNDQSESEILGQEGDIELNNNKIELDETPTPILPTTQPSTGVTLKAVASIPQNLVSGIEDFGTKQEANAEAKKLLGNSPHSIDMVEAGVRTRTTRSVGEIDKYNVKVGDIIKQFGKSADGTTKNILTKVTAIHPKGTPEFLGTWNKEGWTQEGIKAIERYKDGAAAIEFEVVTPTQPSTSVESKTSSIPSERQIKVEQFNITIKPDGKMFYENGNEVTDQTTKNKVNVRKELQDKTLRSSVYNGANYFVLSDDRIVGSGKTNLGKESITDNTIKEKILAKAVTYKKEC